MWDVRVVFQTQNYSTPQFSSSRRDLEPGHRFRGTWGSIQALKVGSNKSLYHYVEAIVDI